MRINRREFVQNAASATLAVAGAMGLPGLGAEVPTANRLPRWRGFNLLEKFVKRREGNPPFLESDFALIEEWGFDFVRLPMSYECWVEPGDWFKLREDQLQHIDQAVEFGAKYKVHVNLNFHRAPGYCVNPPKEPLDLWTDEKALEAAAFHWAHFAKRYRVVGNDRVSFDLLNEPPDIKAETYAGTVKRLVEAIRAEDPRRLIVADGLRWGREPVPELAGLAIGQSTRGYDPFELTHFRASWARGSDKWPEPVWPNPRPGAEFPDKEALYRKRIQPWKELEKKGVGVHVGEWGVFNRTPHRVTLAWMRDSLDLWRQAGWGWSLWNLRGSFGVLDSHRQDVDYEDFRGYKLDRQMLDLLRKG